MKTFIYQRGRRAEPGCGCGREETVRGVELEHLLLPLEGLEGGELREAGEEAARHRVLVEEVARQAAPGGRHRVADQIARVLEQEARLTEKKRDDEWIEQRGDKASSPPDR